MSLFTNGITADDMREMMPSYYLGADLLAAGARRTADAGVRDASACQTREARNDPIRGTGDQTWGASNDPIRGTGGQMRETSNEAKHGTDGQTWGGEQRPYTRHRRPNVGGKQRPYTRHRRPNVGASNEVIDGTDGQTWGGGQRPCTRHRRPYAGDAQRPYTRHCRPTEETSNDPIRGMRCRLQARARRRLRGWMRRRGIKRMRRPGGHRDRPGWVGPWRRRCWRPGYGRKWRCAATTLYSARWRSGAADRLVAAGKGEREKAPRSSSPKGRARAAPAHDPGRGTCFIEASSWRNRSVTRRR